MQYIVQSTEYKLDTSYAEFKAFDLLSFHEFG